MTPEPTDAEPLTDDSMRNKWEGFAFGMWVNCTCGHSFADYSPENEPSNWEKHKMEHSLV